jgi:hypothetical protein
MEPLTPTKRLTNHRFIFSYFGLFDEQQKLRISVGTDQTDIAGTTRMKLNVSRRAPARDTQWL